jgi:hypothetical protein
MIDNAVVEEVVVPSEVNRVQRINPPPCESRGFLEELPIDQIDPLAKLPQTRLHRFESQLSIVMHTFDF